MAVKFDSANSKNLAKRLTTLGMGGLTDNQVVPFPHARPVSRGLKS